ncbi:MAG: low-specificity L-threonine aldolase [Gammaproteobacteria bacterium]|jgi:threonine aldolase
MPSIDLRSDTVTRPTAAMRETMARAEVGDDVYGEDPTVRQLEALTADLLGQEAAVFAPSGTQTNLLALMSHCERGDEYIVGQQGHTYKYEGGGGAVLGSIQPQPLDYEADGSLDLERVAAAIKPDDAHFARTRLLCLENTQGGKVLPLDYLDRAVVFARERGLGLHLDGARVFNAAVSQGVPVERIGRLFDTVSVCLSKGLGAPVGSVLCGKPELIHKARRWRKVLGGGMRQAGILAAGGIHALENHVERLAEDHENARRLAEGLAVFPELRVDPRSVQTNMLFAYPQAALAERLSTALRRDDIIVPSGTPMRLVTHLDIGRDDVDRIISAVNRFFRDGGATG